MLNDDGSLVLVGFRDPSTTSVMDCARYQQTRSPIERDVTDYVDIYSADTRVIFAARPLEIDDSLGRCSVMVP